MDPTLLMVAADDYEPVLDHPLDPAGHEARVEQGEHLADLGGEPNALDLQGWGIVVPDGAEGERLLALIEPLRRHRYEQTGRDVPVYKVPPTMDARAVKDFRHDRFEAEGNETRPGYVLFLGDLDVVPLELQQALVSNTYVGRLAFPSDAGYESYVQKVLDAERAPPRAAEARALFLGVQDGTDATKLGYSALIAPSMAHARAMKEKGKLPVSQVQEVTGPLGDEIANALKKAAADATPSVLFSCSHGLGKPRDRSWSSEDERRERQGALCLGKRTVFSGTDVASGPFLPGGMWFSLACYGAGTPARSAYAEWWKRLYGEVKPHILGNLPQPGERPFVARLPQMALANPQGPLAVIGHCDLAFAFSFTDDGEGGKPRAPRFHGIVQSAANGDRAGIVAKNLLEAYINAAMDTSMASEEDLTRGSAEDAALKKDRALLWMLKNDVGGYILLGDPAVQMPIANRRGHRATARGGAVTTSVPTVGASAPRAPVTAPAPQVLVAAPAPQPPVAAPAPAEASPAASPGKQPPDLEAQENAALDVLNEIRKAAEKLGVEKRDVLAWVTAYQTGGREALKRG